MRRIRGHLNLTEFIQHNIDKTVKITRINNIVRVSVGETMLMDENWNRTRRTETNNPVSRGFSTTAKSHFQKKHRTQRPRVTVVAFTVRSVLDFRASPFVLSVTRRAARTNTGTRPTSPTSTTTARRATFRDKSATAEQIRFSDVRLATVAPDVVTNRNRVYKTKDLLV